MTKKIAAPLDYYCWVGLLTGGILASVIIPDLIVSVVRASASGKLPELSSLPTSIQSNTSSISASISGLFASPQSPGNIAIGHAEGNLTATGQKTQLYLQGGHFDPANGVFNRGFCSDQGRGRNMTDADAKCLKRIQRRIPRLVARMNAAGVPAHKHQQALVNGADLWNQASPDVSDRFSSTTYPLALLSGLKGDQAIVKARVEAFRVGSQLSAGGLFHVCRNWDVATQRRTGLRLLAVQSEEWRRRCIAADQRRRAEAINSALK